MTTLTIDSHNNIRAFDSAQATKSSPQAEHFSSAEELGRLAENWPGSRLVEIWNTLPGQKAVKKFTSRKTAATRIWRVIQNLDPQSAPPAAGVVRKHAKRASRAGARGGIPRPDTKTNKIVELMKRPNGVTLKDIFFNALYGVIVSSRSLR
jgi:hypothetical protein